MNEIDRCTSHNGPLRCGLRPHQVGGHLAVDPEGDPDGRVIRWDRAPDDDVDTDPETAARLREWHAAQLDVPADTIVIGRGVALAPSPEAPVRNGHQRPVARKAAPASSGGYTGDVCAMCGSLRVVRTGTCGTCQDCGSTTGCG